MARNRIRHPDPEPLETNDVLVVGIGTGVFAVALVVALLFHRRLSNDGHVWWIGACAYGVGLGLLGLRFCQRRARAIARDKAAAQPPIP